MPLYMNGILIPENVANAFSFNGSNITDVYFNGVQVWHQSLISITGWSGSSEANSVGFNCLNNGIRARFDTTYGAYIYVNSNGVFDGTTSNGEAAQYGFKIYSSGSSLSLGIGWVVFDPTLERFSGSSYEEATTGYNMESSGGLIRYNLNLGLAGLEGAWISLT